MQAPKSHLLLLNVRDPPEASYHLYFSSINSVVLCTASLI